MAADASAAAGAPPPGGSPAAIFNPRNRLLSVPDVAALTGCAPLDVNLYRKAMTHRSYCTRKNENFLEGNQLCPPGCVPLQEESNERLEFLGDAVLNLVVASYLYERFPDENEGFLTRMRTKLVNGTMLAHLCGLCGLSAWAILSKQIEDAGGRGNKKILEDTFEAFLGALFIDQGFAVSRDWLIAFVEEHLDFTELVKQHVSHKDMLQRYFQQTFGTVPRFSEVPAANPGADLRVLVRDAGDAIVGTGQGPNRKAAENEAARIALVYYGQIPS